MRVEKTTRLDSIYDHLAAVESYVAKALNVSEVTRIARIEGRLFRMFEAKWNARKILASATADRMARQGKSAAAISRAVGIIMRRWSKDVGPRMQEAVREMYRLARDAGWKKASGRTDKPLTYSTENYTEDLKKAAAKPKTPMMRIKGPKFDLVDKKTVQILERQQTFWIGDHYDRNISRAVATTAKESIVRSGLGTREAGRAMGKAMREQLSHVRTPTGWRASQTQYNEMLVANAATVARAQGQMRSFSQLGMTKYRISNPMDRRTCSRCSEMNGKVFTIKQGMEQMQADLSAETPEAVRAAHPWHSVKQVKEFTSGKPGPEQSQKLAAEGMSMPPYHGKCRCAVDVDEDAGSFQPSAAVPPPPLPPKLMPKFPMKPPVTPKGVPGMFPPLPAHPAKPVTLYDHDKFNKALDPTVSSEKLKLLSGENQATVRREVNALFAEQGIEITDIAAGRTHAGSIVWRTAGFGKGLESAEAYHAWDGRIVMRPDTFDYLRKWSPGMKQGTPSSVMQDLLHEAVHGTSPITSGAYRAAGVVVEEASTEMVAMRTMRILGRDVIRGAYPKFRALLQDSIKAGVKSLPTQVQTVLLEQPFSKNPLPIGKRSAVKEIAERSAVKMRYPQKVKFSEPKSYTDHWIKSIEIPPEGTAGMTKKEIAKATGKMRKAVEKKFKELYTDLEKTL